MVKLNDIEKKLQNYQQGSEYNVRYENNGEKRIYTIYPGKALEFIRQVVANTPPPPFLSRPNIKSNSTVECEIEENNGVITRQSFTAKTPASGSDFGRENPSIGDSSLWNSSIFGSGRQFNNQKTLEFEQPSNQDFSVARSQTSINNQQIGICHCNSTIKRTLLDDWNRCLKCGGMFDDAGTEEAKKRQKEFLEKFRREQEENFRAEQEEKERFKQEFMSSGSSSLTSYQQHSYPNPQSRFIEINEDSENMDTEETTTHFFQQQQQQQHIVEPNRQKSAAIITANQSKSPRTALIIGSSVIFVSGIGLLVYLFRKKHMKGKVNQYANN